MFLSTVIAGMDVDRIVVLTFPVYSTRLGEEYVTVRLTAREPTTTTFLITQSITNMTTLFVGCSPFWLDLDRLLWTVCDGKASKHILILTV
jgi:hypothetical protein